MEYPKSIDCPPAITQKEYPIIRCESCYEILTILFNMSKKEITLNCEKEQKKKILPLENFSKQ